MELISMAVRSISTRLGPNPKAAAVVAAASVAAVVVAVPAEVVVVVDRASAANPAGNAPQNTKYGGWGLGPAADAKEAKLWLRVRAHHFRNGRRKSPGWRNSATKLPNGRSAN